MHQPGSNSCSSTSCCYGQLALLSSFRPLWHPDQSMIDAVSQWTTSLTQTPGRTAHDLHKADDLGARTCADVSGGWAKDRLRSLLYSSKLAAVTGHVARSVIYLSTRRATLDQILFASDCWGSKNHLRGTWSICEVISSVKLARLRTHPQSRILAAHCKSSTPSCWCLGTVCRLDDVAVNLNVPGQNNSVVAETCKALTFLK